MTAVEPPLGDCSLGQDLYRGKRAVPPLRGGSAAIAARLPNPKGREKGHE